MTRKMRQPVQALGIAGGFLALALATTIALPTVMDDTGLDDGRSVAGAPLSTGSVRTPARAHRTRAHDAMALPFFSFAQGMRRNRS